VKHLERLDVLSEVIAPPGGLPIEGDALERVASRLLQIDAPAGLQLADSQSVHAYDGYVLEAERLARGPVARLDRNLTRGSRAQASTFDG
jgi:hypothetical protein